MKGRKICFARCRGVIGAIFCVVVGPAAWASGTLCIDNATDLGLALDDAQGTATTIQIVRGTYDLSGSVWGEHNSTVAKLHSGSSLLGGYGAGCTSRNIDVNNTILKSDASASVNLLGDATFEGLTIQFQDGFYVGAPNIAAGSEVLFRRNSISGNVSNAGAIPLYIDWTTNNSGTVRLVDNLIEGNSAENINSDGNGAVTVIGSAGVPKVELVNNTIVDNVGSYKGFALLTPTSVPVYAYNNIFYGNDDLDFYVQAGHTTLLVDNDIGSYFIPTPNTAPVGTLRGDPKLDANFKPIESPASPVINAGTDNVIGGLPSTDLPGRDREIGSEPDLGAYESSVSDSLIQQVTTTADSGPGSLRAAIAGANANGSSGAIISFNIGSGCGPQVIHLATPLPSTTAETHILGFTQPGASANSLQYGDNSVYCVILDGATHQIADGFAVQNTAPNAAALSVNGIAFSGFTHSALNLRGGVGHFINGIRTGGTVNSGTANAYTLADVSYGIILGPGVHGATIGVQNDESSRNVIGGALNDGIHIDESSGATPAAHDNQIVNNYIGVSYVGTTFNNNGNADDGISVGGDTNTIQYNTFGFNGTDGVHVLSADAHDNAINNNHDRHGLRGLHHREPRRNARGYRRARQRSVEQRRRQQQRQRRDDTRREHPQQPAGFGILQQRRARHRPRRRRRVAERQRLDRKSVNPTANKTSR